MGVFSLDFSPFNFFSINTVLDDPLAESNDVEPQIQRADPGT